MKAAPHYHLTLLAAHGLPGTLSPIAAIQQSTPTLWSLPLPLSYSSSCCQNRREGRKETTSMAPKQISYTRNTVYCIQWIKRMSATSSYMKWR
ncbi:hypothetical protein BAUCODRAFT_441500 [Baudoinia panamericana UAMH 10762]|uniref:Uncharacterized protein n=1 Tax=Baudoinia panamericana (strain UAMH 10762) TaxID=717646 RepID=M2MZV4_BAUPA|nr:uncharacterized protein BAUCODRAFT_441500 [Baudoinia panamericana UAMH 10762]EMC97168.1 hypothetical protein BAUCODRAFT_441500 [Baudoinia panamericana UAMH 10762]